MVQSTRAGVLFVLLLVSQFVDSSEDYSASRHATRFLDEGTEYVRVIIGLHVNTSATGDTYLRGNAFTASTQSYESDFSRTAAIVRTIPVSELETLQNDPAVSFIEEDTAVYLQQQSTRDEALETDTLAGEVVPWGIKAVQGDVDGIIPLPPPMNSTGNKCTISVCIVDTGIMLAHPDMVSLILVAWFIPSLQVMYADASTSHSKCLEITLKEQTLMSLMISLGTSRSQFMVHT